MKNILSKVRGFTLVELLVVISIIAILTGIITTNFVAVRGKARDAQRVSDMAQIQLALERFFDQCGQYPPTIVDLYNLGYSAGCPTDVVQVNIGSFISKIPVPPTGPIVQPSYDYYTNSVLVGGVPTIATDYVLHTKFEYPIDNLKNSLPQLTKPVWATMVTCYDPNANQLDYCIGVK